MAESSLPDHGLSTQELLRRAVLESYSSATSRTILLYALEINHPAFSQPARAILFETREQVEAAAEQIRQRIEASGGEVVRDNNRFAKPVGGYRDYQFNYRYPNGFAVELQLNTRAMSQAKESVGHGLYEMQDIAEKLLSNESNTKAEKMAAEIIWTIAKKSSKTLYESTGPQSNETASFSSIVEPYEAIEAATSELAGTSVYGKLSELLATMRNNLQSLVSTYGIPSQSINSETNTGEPSGISSTRMTGRDATTSFHKDWSDSGTSEEAVAAAEAGISQPPVNKDNLTPKSAQGKGLGEKTRNDGNKIIGAETQILGGSRSSEPARYEVWELADVIPSHDPENGFARREDYPAEAQERPYHSDRGEQEKVLRNANEYEPEFVLNTAPSAGDGPPIITRSGIVLGGNSRAMSLALVYANNPKAAQKYQELLAAKAAAQFGLDPESLSSIKRPILVRVVDRELNLNEMAVKSRQYNQTTTQKLQAKAEGVSRGRFLTPETLAELSAEMAEFDSLRQFLDSAKSKGFIQALLRDGVLEQTEISSLTEKNGKLNESGKTQVENALRGLVCPDYDILAATPASTLNKLDRAIPALARLKSRGEGWDMTRVLTPALRLIAKAEAENRKLEGWLGQSDLLDTDPDKKRPAVQAMALTLTNATQKEVLARFEAFAQAAERQQKGVGMLMAKPEGAKPAPAFIKAFMQDLVTVDGKTITDFNPKENLRHAALLWAFEHGGKGKTVASAIASLEKTFTQKKASAAKKNEARELIRELGEYSGTVAIYQPKLGPYFQYQQGQALFQSAFHGSPHKFDKFSLDHIGAGEGNQAHGWGLYFAKDKGISEIYRRELSNRKNRNKIQFLINGEEVSPEIAEKLNSLSSYTLDALVNDGDTSSLKNEIATIITEKKGIFSVLRIIAGCTKNRLKEFPPIQSFP